MDILQRERLLKFGAVPFTTDVIAGELDDYSAVLAKIAALVDEGSLVRIKRGLYCLSPRISGRDLDLRVIANALYSPSYVSFETALSMYGLIPERVDETMSACAKRAKRLDETMSACAKRAKRYATPLGAFSYRTVPGNWFPIGIRTLNTGEGGFLIASPEKALGDLLIARCNLRISSPDSLRSFLEDDIRFDFDAFGSPDKAVLKEMADSGHKPLLMKALERIFT